MSRIRFMPGLSINNGVVLPIEAIKSLSLDAVGLLCHLQLAAMTEGHFEPVELRKQVKIGRDKYQRLLGELMNSGWVVREQPRDIGSQTFGEIEYFLERHPPEREIP